MPRLFATNNGTCIPLVIGDGNSDVGSRLGGLPPERITPKNVTPLTRYFCTVRIAEDPVLEVSLFLSFDFGHMWESAGVIQSSAELFEAITHGESVRASIPALRSELSPHPILHWPIKEDFLIDDEGIRFVEPDHKLGGYPFINDIGEGLPDAVAEAHNEGYFQVFQIGFPGAKDGDVSGSWPFAGGTFHLLGVEPLERCSWRAFWEV